jgi:hypothetical protein
VVNIQFKQLKYAGDSHFDVKIVVTKDGNIQINLVMPSFKNLMGEVVYIPAERAGMMRTYKQLLRLYLESYETAPITRNKGEKDNGRRIYQPNSTSWCCKHLIG